MLEACTNVKVMFDSVVTAAEIINSKKITFTIKEQVPQIMIERSQEINMYLFPPAKGVKINTTCSMTMVVHYPKSDAGEDDEWLDIGIPETNITTIRNDSLHTEATEGIE